MTSKREFRVIPAAVKRSATGDKPAIEGYCAIFDTPAEIDGWLGGFREVVKPGAFARCLAEGADIRCLWQHDLGQILGRTKSKTVTYREDAKGLWFRCTMPDTQLGRDLYALIRWH